ISPTASPSQGRTEPSSAVMRSSTPAMTRPVLTRHSMSSFGEALFGGMATAAMGDVSVIPQAWMILTPWRSWKASMRLRGTAVPLGQGEGRPTGGGHRVQVRRPVAVDHTLGVAGGAARVAHGRRRALVDLGVVVAPRLGGQQLFVGQDVPAQRAGVTVAHDHE